MSLLQVVVLALVQGFTEFLPISSSAHLALAPWLLGWKDQGLAFDIALHFGTLLAVLVYFYRDWIQLIAQGLGFRYEADPDLAENPRMLWMLAAGSIPIGILGYSFKDFVESSLRQPIIIGVMLVAVGLLMELAERKGRHIKTIGAISLTDALWIGVAQALALVPGTSRSGITIVAGLFRDIRRPAAARFSFLLSTPAITAAAAKAFLDLNEAGGLRPEMYGPFLIGMLLSAVTGCLAISVLLRFLRNHSLRFFVVYRVIFGIIVIALVFVLRRQTG